MKQLFNLVYIACFASFTASIHLRNKNDERKISEEFSDSTLENNGWSLEDGNDISHMDDSRIESDSKMEQVNESSSSKQVEADNNLKSFGQGNIGDMCLLDSDCASDRCELLFDKGLQCVEKGKIGETCSNNGDCEDNLECKSGIPWRCQMHKNPNGETCTLDSDCESNRCERFFGEGLKCVEKGKIGETCSNDGDCKDNLVCKYGVPPFRCQMLKNPNGQSCTRDSDCESNRCERFFGKGLQCTSRGDRGDTCSNDGDCKSGLDCNWRWRCN